MVFSSLIFLCAFLPLTLALYYAAPRRWRNAVALAASLFFYSWGAPRFVIVLVGSSLIDYLLAPAIADANRPRRRRRGALTAAIAVNLGFFLYFKYMNFFVDQANWLLSALGQTPQRWTDILLPIGISFFTFQKLSYLVDVYRGATAPAPSFVHYLLYVSLFPQLIAGPIVRYHDIAAQLVRRRHSSEKLLSGLWRFSLGLAKKVLIANVVGAGADAAFGAPAPGAAGAWLGALCYAFQIYFDFSGYSDMAIGIGRMLGFELLENFRAPYIAADFTEFWRRWHISLSNWMREYLYIPLGGNRCGRRRQAVNLWIVFLLSGFWHGAAWNFIVWGLYHGLFLSWDKFRGDRRLPRLPRPLRVAATFLLVLIGWVFFRAETLTEAWAYLQAMAGAGAAEAPLPIADWMTPQRWTALAAAALVSFLPARLPALELADWRIPQGGRRDEALTLLRTAVTAALLLVCTMALVTGGFNPFIYFRF